MTAIAPTTQQKLTRPQRDVTIVTGAVGSVIALILIAMIASGVTFSTIAKIVITAALAVLSPVNAVLIWLADWFHLINW
jgi:hypothetical protein